MVYEKKLKTKNILMFFCFVFFNKLSFIYPIDNLDNFRYISVINGTRTEQQKLIFGLNRKFSIN